ncbi:MAG: prolipoprotein diacylglyceryl transferase [Alphaproteobacteria bacterium]
MLLSIAFPNIDPVAWQIGPVAIRWYALGYIAGIGLGWWHLRAIGAARPAVLSRQNADDFVLWATLGIVLGGRLGYVLFYKPLHYLANPEQIFAVWQGGMSFHGGLIGMIIAIIAFARLRKLPILAVADRVACVVPIGLFFGRLANFVNGELFGRITTARWGVIFPGGGPQPRHPSQIYEALLEGVALYLVMLLLSRSEHLRARPGFLAGTFLIGYAAFRTVAELFREPDTHLGFIVGGVTMGQILCLPMLLVGVILVLRASHRT